MSRYRVEVDHTRTYEVFVQAETVEEAIDAATQRVTLGRSPKAGWPYTAIGTRTVAIDAVELEETPT